MISDMWLYCTECKRIYNDPNYCDCEFGFNSFDIIAHVLFNRSRGFTSLLIDYERTKWI